MFGAAWLATVPPAGLTSMQFGTGYLATLFGLTLLSHHIGSFAMVNTGSYFWMWWADAVLALGAALVNLPIREARLTSSRAAA